MIWAAVVIVPAILTMRVVWLNGKDAGRRETMEGLSRLCRVLIKESAAVTLPPSHQPEAIIGMMLAGEREASVH